MPGLKQTDNAACILIARYRALDREITYSSSGNLAEQTGIVRSFRGVYAVETDDSVVMPVEAAAEIMSVVADRRPSYSREVYVTRKMDRLFQHFFSVCNKRSKTE